MSNLIGISISFLAFKSIFPFDTIITHSLQYCIATFLFDLERTLVLKWFFFLLPCKCKCKTQTCDCVVCCCNNVVAANSLNIKKDSICITNCTHNTQVLCVLCVKTDLANCRLIFLQISKNSKSAI